MTEKISRHNRYYAHFINDVLKRDNYTCQCCGSTDNPHVHHINGFAIDNERGMDTKNGIVLCEECHSLYHSIYGKGYGNNAVSFSKFMRDCGKPIKGKVNVVCETDYVKAHKEWEEHIKNSQNDDVILADNFGKTNIFTELREVEAK